MGTCYNEDACYCFYPENETARPNQLFVFPQWCFHKILLLIIQYTYLKCCFKDLTLQDLILRTKLCGTGLIPQHC